MIRLTSNITLGDYKFDFVNNVEITSTWERLTDTARIVMPRKLRLKKDGTSSENITVGVDGLWRRGDLVEINLGYDNINDRRFTGFITGIQTKLPPEFWCEDAMWQLKQVSIPKYTKTVGLRQLLTDILPSTFSFVADDIDLSKFRITRASVAEVLDYIRRTYGLSAYFRDSVLYVGFAYQLGRTTELNENNLLEFGFYKNIIDDSNLSYLRDDDVSIQVTAVNVHPDNTRTEIKVGDPFGDQRTMYFYNVSAQTLQDLATEALEKLKYEGFRGSFTTFLQPYVKHGDAIRLVDPLIPDRNGIYLVRQVVTTFGMEGGRQEITLDRKI
ncbi:MAG TPA: hypothetical protein VK589_28025 [Chryseolinea sp.]|nr:hypothetical protein [Chryseolinea sp.]